MHRVVIHIDFNSYFATVEQQANPRLRGKPVGVSGGDRLTRTVLGAASVEAKKFGVKTGMRIPEALKLCPNLILVKGDSDKYLACTKRFINILKDYSPYLEVFSIDECFLEIVTSNKAQVTSYLNCHSGLDPESSVNAKYLDSRLRGNDIEGSLIRVAEAIKQRISREVGDWITCSVGISYNKMLAKLAGSRYKPDGLVAILDTEAAIRILDTVELDDICGIGGRIKARLNNMGVFSFSDLREIPLENLLASFKSYGLTLYNWARGVDHSKIVPFYEKEEVKSVGHRLTISHDTNDPEEIKKVLLKLCELVTRRMRAKKLVGKTVSIWYRAAFSMQYFEETGHKFYGQGMQSTMHYTSDGLEVFKTGWQEFLRMWDREPIRMIGVSVSNLRPQTPENLSLLLEKQIQEKVTKALDNINDRFGEFTLQRGILLGSTKIKRMPNPFLADRRFKL